MFQKNKTIWIEKNCLGCGKLFSVSPCFDRIKFCSKRCAYDNRPESKAGKTYVHKECLVCKKDYSIKPSEANESKYCSRKCSTEAQKGITGSKHPNWGKKRPDIAGEKNPHWNGGTSKLDKSRHSDPNYIQWRNCVFDRDDYTCQDCKKRGVYLEAHHIKSWKDYVELRYDVSNGITYCKKCHAKNDIRRKI